MSRAADARPAARQMSYSAMPTSVAASAPKACESAVRCGMAVIGIQIDIAAPMPEPTRAPIRSSVVDDVVMRAACRRRPPACRRAASCMPRRALSGAVRPRRPRMNSTDATQAMMNAATVDRAARSPHQRRQVQRVHRLPSCVEHLEHAVGDHESADDVDRGRGDRDEAEDGAERAEVVAPAATSEPTSEMPRWRWWPTSAACAAAPAPW